MKTINKKNLLFGLAGLAMMAVAVCVTVSNVNSAPKFSDLITKNLEVLARQEVNSGSECVQDSTISEIYQICYSEYGGAYPQRDYVEIFVDCIGGDPASGKCWEGRTFEKYDCRGIMTDYEKEGESVDC